MFANWSELICNWYSSKTNNYTNGLQAFILPIKYIIIYSNCIRKNPHIYIVDMNKTNNKSVRSISLPGSKGHRDCLWLILGN